jgi:hypothetical protein
MGLFSNLFGSSDKASSRKPLLLARPAIGFLNLLGEEGARFSEGDAKALAPGFSARLDSSYQVPHCEVLFLYCRVDPAGQVEGSDSTLPEMIRESGALVTVIASENEADSLMNTVNGKGDWSGNLVLTTDRRGLRFRIFFSRLFERMFEGRSMLAAWVELAPQIPDHDDPGVPSTIMISRGPGHIAFGGGGGRA